MSKKLWLAALGVLTLCILLASMSLADTIKYSIRENVVGSGSVTAQPAQAAEGDVVTLTVAPQSGWTLVQLTAQSGTNSVTVAGSKFTMPAGDVTVTATFREIVEVSDWATLIEKLIGNDNTGGAVRLTGNITAPESNEALTIPATATAWLDLNGHTLDMSAITDLVAIHIFGTMTFADESGSQQGRLVGGNANSAFVFVDGGILNLTGGIITGVNNEFGTICVNNDGSFNMSGGTITGNTNTGEYGTVYIETGIFCMSGGSITNNTGSLFGGVSLHSGSIDMSGGSVAGNTGGYIGGFYIYSGTLNMTGGTIAGNTGSTYCGGVFLEIRGTFNMSGGSIKENKGNYGGICNFGGTVDMSGGSVTGNAGTYGGVYVNAGQIYLSGAPVITGNRSSAGENAPPRNIYLAEGKIITVTGPLSEDAQIGVSTGKNLAAGESVIVTSGLTVQGGDEAAFSFSADTGSLRLNEDGEAELCVNPSGFSAWQRLCERVQTNGTIRLDEDCIAAPGDEWLLIPTDIEVVLDLNGYTLDASAIGGEAAIGVFGTLTIEDGSADGTGQIVGGGKEICAIVVNRGTLNLSGGTITGSSGENGAVYIFHGAFNMSGGTITGNGGRYAGGVYAEQSTLNMSGGVIAGNTGAIIGGMIVYSCPTFSMTGGSINDNTGGEVGGIYIYNCVESTIANGTVTGNKGSQCGGIYLEKSSFRMKGCIISGNTGYECAGGVYVDGSEFNMLGGTITGNTGNTAGGVHAKDMRFNMSGGSITGNSGKIAGGLIIEKCVANMTGGSITGNTGNNCGGVYLGTDGTISISGNPLITENTSGTGDSAAISNVYLPVDKRFDINEALSDSARIGVSMEAPGVFTSALSGKGTVSNFTSDEPERRVKVNGEDMMEMFVPTEDEKLSVGIVINGPGTVTASVDGRASNWAAAGNAVTVKAVPEGDAVLASIAVKDADSNDVPLTDNCFTMPDKGVTVTATFRTYTGVSSWTVLKAALAMGGGVRLTGPVTAAAGDTALEVPAGVNSTLDLNGYTLNAEAITDNSILVVQGVLTLEDGSSNESGCFENSSSHKEIILVDGGTFFLNGGTIANGGAVFGAVHLVGGTFDMSGGAIIGLTGNASPVFVDEISTFNMSGGLISENKFATSAGVYTKGNFNMSGGRITGNAGDSNGGVAVDAGKFTISGRSEIIGNTARNNIISNVSLKPDCVITVNGQLDQDARIGVGMNVPGVFTDGLPGKGTVANFSSDNPYYHLQVDNDGEVRLVRTVYKSITVQTTGDEGPDVTVLVNGEMASVPGQAVEGDIVTLILSGFPEYMQPNLTMTPESGTETPVLKKNGVYSFEMPDENVTVTATLSIPEDLVINNGDIPVGQFQDNATIRTVTIGPGVTSIGANAFRNCAQLAIVTIKDLQNEDGIVIGNEAFVGCSNLSVVNIGKGVKQIGENAFIGCTSLVKLYVGEDVESIGDYAFFGCFKLTEAAFGSGPKTIGQYAFANCSGLTSIEIPDGVTKIGVGAFKDCAGLTRATLPGNMNSVGGELFTGCNNLKIIWYHGAQAQWNAFQVDDLPTGTVVRCFTDAYGEPAFTLPTAMETIGANAFAGAGMTEAYIPDGCKTIGAGAFVNSTIVKIRIPSSVTSIDKTAFDGCYLVIYGKAGSKAKTYCSKHSDTCLFVEEK